MSTKTSIKRIALVAVSALGFGLLTVVPAKAALTNPLVYINSVGSTSSTTAVTGRVNTYAISISGALSADTDDLDLVLSVVSKPSASLIDVGNSVNYSATALPRYPILGAGAAYLSASDDITGAASGVSAGTIDPVAKTGSGETAKIVVNTDAATTLTRAGVATLVFTPDVSGTYELRAAYGGATGQATVTIVASAPTTSAVLAGATSRKDRTGERAVIGARCGAGTGAAGMQFVSGPSDQTEFSAAEIFMGSANAQTATTQGGVTINSFSTSNRVYDFAVQGNSAVTNGTYTFRSFCDFDSSSSFTAADGTATTHTVVVADNAKGVASVTLSTSSLPTNNGATTYFPVQVTAPVTDADGVASYLIPGEFMQVTMGSLTGATNIGTTNTGQNTPGDGLFGFTTNQTFLDGRGVLWVNGKVGVGAYKVTVFGPGGVATDGASATLTVLRNAGLVTGMTAVSAAGLVFDPANNGVADTSATTATITASTAVGTITYRFTGADYTAGETVPVTVTAQGTTGPADLTHSLNVPVLPDGTGSFTVTNAAPSTGDKYTVTLPKNGGGTLGFVVTYSAPKPTWDTTTQAPAAAFTVKNLSTNTVSAVLSDGYGVVQANKSVTITVTGRNPSTTTATTDATGKLSFTLADAAAVAAATTDTIVFSHPFINTLGNSDKADATFTITYNATGVVVGTVTVTATGAPVVDTVQQLGVVAGTAIIEYAATVADSNGIPLTAGNVVTWSGGADDIFVGGVKSSTTNALGVATIKVYRNKVGYGTITATIGGVSGAKNNILWTTTSFAGTAGSPGNTNVFRNIAAVKTADAVAGGVIRVTATVTDRWGNGVSGVPVTITITGAGRLLSPDATGKTTDSTGQVQYNITSNTGEIGEMKATLSVLGGQTLDPAGYVDQPGVGGQVLVSGVTAGNDKIAVTANFTKDTSVSTAEALLELAKAIGTGNSANAAADAALEAIDAANAATDAANLAAEAADAATVAAEEARDAADAATAAVEALASEVATLVAALKAQITTLANTVAKIAKRVRA